MSSPPPPPPPAMAPASPASDNQSAGRPKRRGKGNSKPKKPDGRTRAAKKAKAPTEDVEMADDNPEVKIKKEIISSDQGLSNEYDLTEDVDNIPEDVGDILEHTHHIFEEPTDDMQIDAPYIPYRPILRDHRANILKRLADGSFDEDPRVKKTRTVSPPDEPMLIEEISETAVAVVNEFADPDRRKIKKPENNRCAIQVRIEGDAIDPPTVGDPWGNTTGYSLRLAIDGGRYGLPYITLFCRIDKPKKSTPEDAKGQKSKEARGQDDDAMDADAPDEKNGHHEIKATWRPGVKAVSHFMIDNMAIQQMTKAPVGVFPHTKDIDDRCPMDGEGKLNQTELDRILAFRFDVATTRIGEVEEEWWAHLPDEVTETFRRIFSDGRPFQITFWTTTWPHPEGAMSRWGEFLAYQINKHVPPFAQYQNSDGQMVLDWDVSEAIQDIGKGMYCIYHTSKGGIPDMSRPPREYFCFPRRYTWQEFSELAVTIAMPIVRDVQHLRNQVAYVNTTEFGIYVQRIPTVIGKKKMDDKTFCFVRMSPGGDDKNKVRSGRAPPPGSSIKLCLSNANSAIGKPHIEPGKNDKAWFYGTVVEDFDGCAKTGTDFCIWLSVNPTKSELDSRETLMDLEDRRLMSAYMRVKVDVTAAERDLDGALRLADPTFDTETLSSIREAIMQNPQKIKHKVVNLAQRKPGLWQDFKEQCAAPTGCGENKEQLACIVSLEKMDNKFQAVAGPPGTGKTRTLAYCLIGAVIQNYKILAVAPLNIAVDNAANKFYELLPAKYKVGNQEKFFLRLETKGAEFRAYIAIKDYRNLDREDLHFSERPTFIESPEDAVDPADLATAWAESISDWKNYNDELAVLWKKSSDYAKAIKTQSKLAARKKTNVPVKMTSGWHIHCAVIQDLSEATASLERERQAWVDKEPLPEREIENYLKDDDLKPLLTEGLLKAMRGPRISQEEFDAGLAGGAIKSVDQRRKYFKYTELADRYVETGGHLPEDEAGAFEVEWLNVMRAVFARLDGVFTSCNNVGSGLVDAGFKPDALYCDEAGQVPLASLGLILTTFTAWKAVYLFGDPQQLHPFLGSAGFNEFKWNAILSALGLFDFKNYNMIHLVVQYRMAPAIVDWVNRFFYGGNLQTHPTLLEDNQVRAEGRRISRDFYGLLGEGSEYLVINVENGQSHRQRNNTSLVNHTNSAVIVEYIDRILEGGIVQPEEIAVLTHYSDQKFLHIRQVEESAKKNGRSWNFGAVEYSTVDAYQGKEIRVGIVDLVVASSKPGDYKDNLAEDEDDGSAYQKASTGGRVSAHVRDPHRLCCALTRFQDVLVVVCQATILTAAAKAGNQKRETAAIIQMVRDADDRNLIYTDTIHEDDSPAGKAERASWGPVQVKQHAQNKKAQRDAMYSKSLPRARKAVIVDPIPEEIPVYMTRFGKTSRPTNMKPAVKAVATDDKPKRTLQELRDDPTALIPIAPLRSRQNKEAKKAKREEAAKRKEVQKSEEMAALGKKVIRMTVEETAAAEGVNKKAQEHGGGRSSGV